ncbi:MAG: protein phosphatase [Chloroflexi bacterium B3_Chlor]|nr:MAG: protein phosphatase [Chloroflexi bacterium B3_Chlor]
MSIWKRLFGRRRRRQEATPSRKAGISREYQRVDPLEIGQGTDIGKARRANEDTFLTLKSLIGAESEPLPVGLLIVADGMGGHVKGKEASSLATRVAGGVIVRDVLLPVLTGQASKVANRPIHEVLTEATMSANQAVSEMESNAGTTLTSVLVVGHSAYVAHVGDTRVYYLDDSGLKQITQDHSLVNRLVELGQISAQEAHEHPQRNFLYRAVGQGHELKVDTYFQRLKVGSHLILCSDGLWNPVPEEEMVDVVRSSSSPQEACNRLVDRANERGGEDNITLLLARVNH